MVFDFDGTLVDSNQLKHEAWFQVFGLIDCSHEETDAFLAARPLADRFELITDMLRLRTGMAPEPDVVGRLSQRYNKLCEGGQATCPEIPGAGEMLATVSRTLPLYINSATPEESLRRIVARRRWNKLFRGVYGRPAGKAEILARIVAQEKIPPDTLAMVGDGAADVEAARIVGARFFAVGELKKVNYGERVGSLPALCSRLLSK